MILVGPGSYASLARARSDCSITHFADVMDIYYFILLAKAWFEDFMGYYKMSALPGLKSIKHTLSINSQVMRGSK